MARKAGVQSDFRRRHLQAYITDQRLQVTPWAKAAGLSESTIRNFLDDTSKSMSDRTYEALAAHETKRRGIKVLPAHLRGEIALVLPKHNSSQVIEGEHPAISIDGPEGSSHIAGTKRTAAFARTAAPSGAGDFQMARSGVAALPDAQESGASRILAFYLRSNCMWPRYLFNEMVAVHIDTDDPPQLGDHVLIALRGDGDMADCYVRRLAGMQGRVIKLEQYNPPEAIEICLDDVDGFYRVLTMADILQVT